jgi:hypothetical protein
VKRGETTWGPSMRGEGVLLKPVEA